MDGDAGRGGLAVPQRSVSHPPCPALLRPPGCSLQDGGRRPVAVPAGAAALGAGGAAAQGGGHWCAAAPSEGPGGAGPWRAGQPSRAAVRRAPACHIPGRSCRLPRRAGKQRQQLGAQRQQGQLACSAHASSHGAAWQPGGGAAAAGPRLAQPGLPCAILHPAVNAGAPASLAAAGRCLRSHLLPAWRCHQRRVGAARRRGGSGGGWAALPAVTGPAGAWWGVRAERPAAFFPAGAG